MSRIKEHYSFIRILTGSDLSNRRMPRMAIRHEEAGPLVVFSACMHGDEIGGTVIIHELFKRLKKKLLKGSVVAFPLLNPFGFETVSRNIAMSKEDLNRSFPGNDKGTLAERIATIIFSNILKEKPALAIDLHNDWNKSIPYVLLDPFKPGQVDREILTYAGSTGLLQIEDTDRIESSLTYNLVHQGIPALVLELGEAYIINEKNIEIGLKAIWNILRDMGMVADDGFTYRFPLPEQVRDKILKYSPLPLSSTSGIVRFLRKPGDIVKKGQKIAKVYNAFGKQIEIISAQSDGIIIGHTDSALAFPGSPVMAFGLF
mgnify:CR=1 FL=1